MTARISQRDLENYLWGAAVVLRGLIDAGDYKQYIFGSSTLSVGDLMVA
jgi:type I restriction-modification system DNA methylase subunit